MVFAETATNLARSDVDFCNQIRRSSRSAPRLLAEGFGRFYPADFARFTRMALGSLHETTDHVDAGFEMRYFSRDIHGELLAVANRAIGACVNLVKYLDGCKKIARRKGPQP